MTHRFLVAPRLWLLLVALGLCGCAASSVPPAQRPSPPPADAAGSWQGVVVFEPNVVEVDVTADLFRRPDDAWGGMIDIPVQRISDYPLRNVRVSGSDISFDFVDPTSTTVFQGTLSPDGNTIRGQATEGGSANPFTLTRRSSFATEPPRPELSALSASGRELRDLFERDRDKVRLVLLLSPT